MEQSSRRAWGKLREGSKLQEVTEKYRGEKEGRSTYTTPRRYRHDMG
jgi:hypothetical protein